MEKLQCPAYEPPFHVEDEWDTAWGGLIAGIGDRPDLDYARSLVGVLPTEAEEKRWNVDGWCEVPKTDLFVSC